MNEVGCIQYKSSNVRKIQIGHFLQNVNMNLSNKESWIEILIVVTT